MTAASESADLNIERYLFLCGGPSARDYVRFVKTASIGGQADEVELTEHWREANARLGELEVSEAGFADIENLPELPPRLRAKAAKTLEDPTVKQSLGYMPFRWAYLELDRLVVYQKTINMTYAARLQESLSNHIYTDEDLMTLTTDGPGIRPSLHAMQVDGNTFSFASASQDLRVRKIALINQSETISRSHSDATLEVSIGFGLNLALAFYIRNRVILLNASHRFYAARARGCTHVPCLVQCPSHDREIDLIGVPEVKQNINHYLFTSRPPLFKDYFDQKLSRVVEATRKILVLRVHVEIQESMIPSV